MFCFKAYQTILVYIIQVFWMRWWNRHRLHPNTEDINLFYGAPCLLLSHLFPSCISFFHLELKFWEVCFFLSFSPPLKFLFLDTINLFSFNTLLTSVLPNSLNSNLSLSLSLLYTLSICSSLLVSGITKQLSTCRALQL